MSTYILIGLFILVAYVVQILLGLKQIKHFNENYQRLRQKGKVAIGKRPGKIKAGTIIMFALDNKGNVLEAVSMQGVTVAARFKSKDIYVGENIKNLTTNHELVVKENKLTKEAILEARKLYIQVSNGSYQEPQTNSSFELIKNQLIYKTKQVKNKLTNN